MAPGGGRRTRDVQFPHELGKVGRRTGITVPDSGVRDENGLEPMDHLFSSPEKAAPVNVNGNGASKKMPDLTNSSEEDMDVVDSTIPDPVQVLTNQQRASLRPPRSKSPRKTYLQSPARHNPSMGRGSSVDGTDSVVRQLDFTNGESSNGRRAATSPPRQLPRTGGKHASSKLSNGVGSSNKLKRPFAFEEEEEESIAPVSGGVDLEDTNGIQEDVDGEEQAEMDGALAADENDNDGFIQNDEEEDAAEEVQEPEPVPVSKGPGKGRGRPGKSKATEPPAKSKVVEPPARPVKEVAVARGKARGRRSREKTTAAPVQEEEPEEEVEEPEEVAPPAEDKEEDMPVQRRKRQKLSPPAVEQPKRGKGRSAATATAQEPEAPKVVKATRVKKVKAPKPVASSPPEVIRQPPRPNTHGGLYISRRETTNEAFQTRSGRHSIKPLAHWRNERIIYEESEIPDQEPGHFNTIAKQSIAEIVRIDEAEPEKRKRGGRRKPKVAASKSKKRSIESDDEDDEEEPWESEPGRFVGEVRPWNPDDPLSASGEPYPEEIALSHAAIQTRDIPGSSFKFAKTMTLPFFGSGMVDLPAGGIKKPKNSRKMHMCFFVFFGRVKVTVNQSEFRIGKGGMWQVPRGNFYSIENDYEKPARIFFSQGCEVEEAIPEE